MSLRQAPTPPPANDHFPDAPLPNGGGDGTSGGMEARVAALETHVEHMRGDIGALKGDVHAIRSDVGTLKTDVVLLRQRVDDLPTKGYIVKVVTAGLALIAALMAAQTAVQTSILKAPTAAISSK